MKRSRLLNRLWEFQNNDGYISDKAVLELSQKLRVSKTEIEVVISFYHFFHRQPTGKYIIYLNNSIISEFKDFEQVKVAFEKETGCTFGNYCNNPLFSLFETSCIGLSDQETAEMNNRPLELKAIELYDAFKTFWTRVGRKADSLPKMTMFGLKMKALPCV